MKKSHKLGMWQYLESIPGLLETGDQSAVTLAKKEWRKQYMAEYKRKQRSTMNEYYISLVKGTPDHDTISKGAKSHDMSIPAFIRHSALCYLRKKYLVPNKMQMMQIEQRVGECLNENQTIARRKERFSFEREIKLEEIEKRIERMEKELSEYLHEPLPFEEYVKRTIANDPALKNQLLSILGLQTEC